MAGANRRRIFRLPRRADQQRGDRRIPLSHHRSLAPAIVPAQPAGEVGLVADGEAALLDVLLAGAAVAIERDDALGRPRQVGNDEADTRAKLARVPFDLRHAQVDRGIAAARIGVCAPSQPWAVPGGGAGMSITMNRALWIRSRWAGFKRSFSRSPSALRSADCSAEVSTLL